MGARLVRERDAPVINITGELVALGPPRRDLIPIFQRWMNDFSTTRTLAIRPRPMTLEQETAWYDGLSAAGEHLFTIYEHATWRVIGNCGIFDVDRLNRKAEVGIVIGEPDARGRGYGTEAMRLLLDYGFTVLGMHSIMLRVYAYNPAARRSYEKAGFREIGSRRESIWHAGRFWDEIVMDILAAEFTSPVLKGLLEPDGER
jgi:RimJ/RimL family protein N-acetyltransferase